MITTCPHCGLSHDVNVGRLLSSVRTPRKAAASRKNGAKGGWPKGRPRKPISTASHPSAPCS